MIQIRNIEKFYTARLWIDDFIYPIEMKTKVKSGVCFFEQKKIGSTKKISI